MYVFDSVRESQRYKELKLLERAGTITDLELQPRFLLQDSFKKNGRTFKKIEYVADFQYIENGKTIVEDVKGLQTDVFKLKHKIFEKVYPDLELKIIKQEEKMNREIKFRGKLKEKGMKPIFFEGSLIHVTSTYKDEENEQECNVYQIVNEDGAAFFVEEETIRTIYGTTR